MRPETLKIYETALRIGWPTDHWAMKIFAGPRHFHVSDGVARAALAISAHEAKASEMPIFPIGARLPGPDMILTDPRGDVMILLDEAGGWVSVSAPVLVRSGLVMVPVVAFCAGTGLIKRPDKEAFGDPVVQRIMGQNPEMLSQVAFNTAITLSLINAHSTARINPEAGARSHRRRVERATGKAAQAWSTVTWNLGQAGDRGAARFTTQGHPKALHWCRAHWRNAEEGQPRSEWVDPRDGGGPGWHTWVKDCWKGHPQYGIKLQRHEPKLPGEAREQGGHRPTVLDETRLAALGAAQRQALEQSGHVPSARLR